MAKRKGSNSTSPSKRSKQSGGTLYWEWEGDKSAWTAFADDNNQEIQDAYENGKKSIKMSVAGCEIEVKLDRMVQRNCKTGWERRIRSCVEDSGSYFVWQWQDEKKRWNAYPPDVTTDLEEAFKSGQTTVPVVASHGAYTVDVKKMEQSNDTTSIIRKVQRMKSDHKAPPAATTPPPQLKRGRSSTSQASTSTAAATTSKTPAKTEASGDNSKPKVKKEASENGKSGPSRSKSSGSQVKTVRLTGNSAPVDSECSSMIGKAHVYKEGSTIFDAMLNQTNLKNNNNKYYICQLLEENNKARYYVWFRWGRVGMKGQNNLVPCGPDLADAKSVFEKKFWDKTRNEWSQRNSFEKVAGKYDMLEMDYSTKGADEPDSSLKTKKDQTPESKLDKKIQEVVRMICNVKSMEELVVEMKYDAQKAPLGKLTADQIKAGYLALKKIETCITNNVVGDKLIKACDEFYTRVPHNFGMQRPPVIRSKQELKAKLALLEALSDIQIAMTVLKQEQDTNENPVDNQYHSLKCELTPLPQTHADVKMIKEYVKNTHAKTHTQYTMEVQEVFSMDRHGEQRQFTDVGNRMLLWHGSRLTNLAGIMGQGLRIAPPEAPVTGYMFGKGVYFADMSSKSANYCFASKTKPVGFLVLCEVALGNTNDLLAAEYSADKLPSGKQSVKGLGKMAPNPSANITMSDGTIVPLGKSCNTGVTNPNGYTLNYNEYVVYDVKQIKMRYLVQTKFNFK